jgi:Trk K+ transport system NAD-binding subunit
VAHRGKSPTAEVGLGDRFRYRFDNVLSRGVWVVLLWLGVVTLVVVLVSSVVLAFFSVTFSGSDGSSWLEGFWQSLLRTVDPGTMAADVGWGRRALALIVTIFGLLVAGTLIGIIASGVEQRVEKMRQGRSTVVESGHIVILGATPHLPVIVEQLALARRRGANTIVVLASREPAELQREVRSAVSDLHRTRLVFRSGDPTNAVDLDMMRVQDARAAIVLSDEDGLGDAGVVKTVLAVGATLGGFDRMPIIAEFGDPETGESLVAATGGAVHMVASMRSIARITTFALHEPGLSHVVQELIDSRGCNIYVREVGDLAGCPFGEAVTRFANARPLGRVRPGGEIEINPAPDTVLESSDHLIVLADDGRTPMPATSELSSHAPVSVVPDSGWISEPRQEHVLIVGWNALGAQLLSQMVRLAAPGSSAEIVYDPRVFESDELEIPEAGALDVTLTPSKAITWRLAHAARRSQITSILLLAYKRGISADEADSRTLMNLMSLRRELAILSGASPQLVVELVDSRDVELAQMTGADDYIVSHAIASRIIAQLAEQPERRPILLSLYAGDGPSVRLVQASNLGLAGEVGWDEIIATAYASGLIAIGSRRIRDAGAELVLNPKDSDTVLLADGDQLVVIG